MAHALGKEADAAGRKVALCHPQQIGQRGERAGRKHVRSTRLGVLDALGHDICADSCRARDSTQELGLPLIRFDQTDPQVRARLGGEDGDDEPGKPRARSKIAPAPRGHRGELDQLRRIEKVPRPRLVERSPRHQIDPRSPLLEKVVIGGQPLECFT